MLRQGKSFEDAVLEAAIEANVDNAVTVEHLDTSITYISEIWKYGETFKKWINSGGYAAVRALF